MDPETILVRTTASSDGWTEIWIWLAASAVWCTVVTALRCGAFLPLDLFRLLLRRYSRATCYSGLNFIRLNLDAHSAHAALRARQDRTSLCTNCIYAHIVRGYEKGEEFVTCGYAFPPRDVLVAVRECSDYKAKRERIDVEVAVEGAVSSPPLEELAADFRVAAAVSPSAWE
jgi:hypothetical protein